MEICVFKSSQQKTRQNSKSKIAHGHCVVKVKLFINNFFLRSVFNGKGQVIVEYIFLLVVSSVMALALIKLVSVAPGDNSPVFKYWENLLKVVGQDIST